MEMDMIIPLNLNSKKKKENVQQLPNCDSASNDGPSATKLVLGPEQAKKRLLAFAQQWNKTKESLNTDNCLQRRTNRHGILKYTYVVEGENGEEISFPAHLIQYTKTEPQISYCENPHYAKGVFQSRKEVFDAADEDTKRIMHFIMNSAPSSYQNREFAGRYRKWYVSKKIFVGKSVEDSENQSISFSTTWETDSEEETSYRENTNYDMDFLPQPPPNIINTKVISKVKINKVELPFFEDDDFLTSLISSPLKVKKEIVLEPPKSETKAIQEAYSAFMSSLENINEKRDIKQEPMELPIFLAQNIEDEKVSMESKQMQVTKSYSPSLSLESTSHLKKIITSEKIEIRHELKLEPSQSPIAVHRDIDDGVISREKSKDNGIRKRCAPSPDWDEQWRSSRYRPSREGTRDTSPILRKEPSTPDENHKEDDWEDGKQSNNRLGDVEAIDAMMSDAKRISLDERLELELGIKVESEIPTTISMISPQSVADQYSWHFDSYGMSTSPVKRARGFGPKAAPLGPWILHCRNRALPAAPYVPPHLQNVLYQPLVRTCPPKTEDNKLDEAQQQENEINTDTQSQGLATPDQDTKKDWDKELKNLEAVANNLEVADETVLEALEEKLMQFETSNILLSGGESPTSEVKDDKNKVVKRGKRPKPPPVELKEAGKGILVMPRISLLDEKSGNQKKAVVFADSVRPGYGTSSEEEDEHGRSPPPPVIQPVHVTATSPKKKLNKPKKEKIVGDDFDPVFDLLPPPPPPPGSPQPPQIKALIPSSSPTPHVSPPIGIADALVVSSPQPIESGSC